MRTWLSRKRWNGVRPDRHQRSAGFTVVELLVLCFIVTVLMGLLLSALSRSNHRPARISCLSNLKQIGLAFRMWANDHGDVFPMEVSASETNGGSKEFNLTGEVWRHFQVLTNELNTPKVLACRSDSQRPKATEWSQIRDNEHLSYFVGLDADETKPHTLLSGDRNIAGEMLSATGVLTFRNGDRVEWTKELHNLAGNIALADGSAHQLTDSTLVKQFQAALNNSRQPVLRLAIPK